MPATLPWSSQVPAPPCRKPQNESLSFWGGQVYLPAPSFSLSVLSNKRDIYRVSRVTFCGEARLLSHLIRFLNHEEKIRLSVCFF